MPRILDFLRKKRAPQPLPPSQMNLAFVLLPDARLPDASAVAECYSQFEPGGRLEVVDDDSGASDQNPTVTSFSLASGQHGFVALMPAPVPNGEADDAARFSVGSFGTGWTLPPHAAHLVVTAPTDPATPPVENLSRFTSFVAAVARASGSVAVYWGNAGATHGAEFFTSIASEQGVTPRMVLWTGVSIARDSNRLSLLSLGMGQLNLPDLLLSAPASAANDALAAFFDLLGYVASRGEAIPDGDTVGRTAEERLKVRYVASPIDRSRKVWSVELQ